MRTRAMWYTCGSLSGTCSHSENNTVSLTTQTVFSHCDGLAMMLPFLDTSVPVPVPVDIDKCDTNAIHLF